jgi:hypothetical protein
MRPLRARPLALVLALSVALASPRARADEAAEKLEAQKLLTLGNAAANDGDYVTALKSFQAAYLRYKSPKILLNIGTTQRQLGRNVEAAVTYEAYVKDPQADPARARDLERILGEIDAVVSRLRVEVNRPDVTVRLDGRELAGFVSGAVLRVEPGEHTIVAEHPGLPPAVATVRLHPREEHKVSLMVVAASTRTVVVERRVAGPQRTIGVVIGGVGLAGLAAGAAAGVAAVVENGGAHKHCYQAGAACDQQGADQGASAKTAATVSTIALAAGGGLLVTGVILFFTAPSKPRTGALPTGAVRLAAGPGSVQLGGAW